MQVQVENAEERPGNYRYGKDGGGMEMLNGGLQNRCPPRTPEYDLIWKKGLCIHN
jgi:hypothetical protein